MCSRPATRIPPAAAIPARCRPSRAEGHQRLDPKKKKKQQKSEQEFRDGYRAAYALVQAGDYKAAFAAFKALDADDTPDVANYLGYTARKLGDYELSKVLVRARARRRPEARAHLAVLRHVAGRAGQHAQGQDFLERIEAICGNKSCKEYQDLKGGMEGTVTY